MPADSILQIHRLQAVAGVLDASGNVLAILEWRDGDLFVCEANDAFRRMGDYHPDQLIGSELARIIAPESERELMRLCEAASRGVAYQGELLALGRQGRRYWFGLHVMPADRHGLFVGLGRDITARKAEADQAAAVQSLLARVFMAVDVPIAISDSTNRIAMINPAHEKLFGMAAAERAGRPAIEMVAPAFRERYQQEQQLHWRKSTPFRIELDLLTTAGREIPVRFTSRWVERSDRQMFRISTIVPDPLRLPATTHIGMHGRLRLVSLAELRAHFGAGYGAVAAKVEATARHVLAHRLESHDSFLATPEGDYCVAFAALSEDEALVRAAAIGHEIRARLIGDEPEAMVEVDPAGR